MSAPGAFIARRETNSAECGKIGSGTAGADPATEREGRQMNASPRPLERQCEWDAATVAEESVWTVQLGDRQLAEIDAALRHARAKTDDVLAIDAADFPLATLSGLLSDIAAELVDGRGFVRIRGIDRTAYDQTEMEIIYWGVGLHLGQPWPQNRHGHVLGDVTDQHVAVNDPTTRGNELGGVALPLHSDGSDLVGLMCLTDGLSGGASIVANAVTVHNRLVVERPVLAATLYGDFPYDFRGEQAPGAPPFYVLPVFTEWEGRLFIRCIPPYITSSQRHPEAPRLTDAQREALEVFVAMANDPANQVHMQLAPGDLQFINNYHVLHGRMAYEDDRPSGAIRHLKRLWLETSRLSSRPAHFARPSHSHWSRQRSASRMRVS